VSLIPRLVSRRRDLELAEEIQAHLDEKIDALVESGLTRAEAERAARRAFGNVTLTAERARGVWRHQWIDIWQADVRCACRQLRKYRSSTLVAALSIALGICATTAASAVLYGVLIEPYPYREADRIVHLHVFAPGGFLYDLPLSSAQFDEFKRAPVVDAAIAMDVETMTRETGDLPEPVNAALLSPDAFAFLGVPAFLGRTFTAKDARDPRAPDPVAVLSYRFWLARFGGSPDVIGRTMQLDRRSYRIVGVMPKRFAWWTSDVYLPLAYSDDPDRLASVFARLPPGVSDVRAEQALQRVVEQLAGERPGRLPSQFRVRVLRMNEMAAGQSAGTLRMIGFASASLLLIACANVSILLLARGTTRTAELATRVALGASRARVASQLVTESLVVSSLGAAAGLLGAYEIVGSIPRYLPAGIFPAEAVLRVSVPVLVANIAAAILSGAAAGLWPAFEIYRRPAVFAASRGHGPTAGLYGNSARGHRALLVTQVAMAVVLVAGAGASARTLTALHRAVLNYDPHNLSSMRLDLRDGTYRDWSSRVRFYERLRRAVAAAPDVKLVALSQADLPPAPPFHNSIVEVPGAAPGGAALVSEVSESYFSTVGLGLDRGRLWTSGETARAAPVAIVNDALAMRFWPRGDPVGHWVHLPDLRAGTAWELAAPWNDGWVQIVGVVDDVPNLGLNRAAAPAIYVPYTLVAGDSVRLIVRSASGSGPIVRTFAEEVRAVDPDQAIGPPQSAMDLLDSQGWARERAAAALFGLLAVMGLLLAAAGLYSVISYLVAAKQHEFSVRLALGAERGAVVGMVVSSALEPTIAGVGLGVAISLLGDAALRRWTETSVKDPLVLAMAVLTLLVTAVVAAGVPAYRAALLDPMAGLRAD